jgi:hypothetical protein
MTSKLLRGVSASDRTSGPVSAPRAARRDGGGVTGLRAASLLVLPISLSLLGCGSDGTCVKEDRNGSFCHVGMPKAGCVAPETFTAEGKMAGIAHCKSLGLTRAVGPGNQTMKEEEVNAKLSKGDTVMFAKP